MRVAVIGAGSMGAFHAQVLGAMSEVELLVVDVDAARAGMVADRAGGSAIGLEKAMERAEAIVVATPPEYHAAAVEVAIGRGIHVLCEKPLTDALASSIALAERARAAGAHLELGFQRRHDPGFLALRDAVAGQPIHLVRLTAFDPRFDPPGLDHWAQAESAPLFRDSSIHDFDFVRWITGQEVVSVTAEGSRRDEARPEDPRGIETAVVTMRCSRRDARDPRGELAPSPRVRHQGRGPRRRARRHRGPLVAHTDPASRRRGAVRRAAAGPATWNALRWLRGRDARFRGGVPRRGAPTSSADDGVAAMRIAVAATRSYRERRQVALDEITAGGSSTKTEVAPWRDDLRRCHVECPDRGPESRVVTEHAPRRTVICARRTPRRVPSLR